VNPPEAGKKRGPENWQRFENTGFRLLVFTGTSFIQPEGRKRGFWEFLCIRQDWVERFWSILQSGWLTKTYK